MVNSEVVFEVIEIYTDQKAKGGCLIECMQ